MERKYQMVRVRAGDYLLPSNSGRSLWRINRYTDGPSMGLVDMKKDREFWACSRYSWMGKNMPEDTHLDEVLDQDHWVHVEGWKYTRQEAIDTALECAERRGI